MNYFTCLLIFLSLCFSKKVQIQFLSIRGSFVGTTSAPQGHFDDFFFFPPFYFSDPCVLNGEGECIISDIDFLESTWMREMYTKNHLWRLKKTKYTFENIVKDWIFKEYMNKNHIQTQKPCTTFTRSMT